MTEPRSFETSQPLVSVVTPVYNGEPYLSECIESVLSQRYENWEYVIVDNCSTDRSVEISQKYSASDTRIRLVKNTEHLDVIPNFNRALRYISPASEYFKVIHADDWIFPDCLREMVALAESNPTVGLVSAYRQEENEVTLDGLPLSASVISGRDICRAHLLGGVKVFGSPSSHLLRSATVRSREIFYDETILHADTEVCFEILKDWDFGFVHQVLTFTRRHNESVSSKAMRLGTRQIENVLGLLLKYGPAYLSENEMALQCKKVFRNYYRFLAQSALEVKGREFWDYQRSCLKQAGYPLSVAKLARFILLELLDLRQAYRRLRRGIIARRGERAVARGKVADDQG